MSRKVEILFLFTVLLMALSLRLYAASIVPLAHDELEKIQFAQEILFSSENRSLPLGSEITHNGPLLPYLIKASFCFFGENKLAARFPSLLYSTLTLAVLYFLVKAHVNQTTAVVCLLFLSFSQLHIGFTRIVSEDGFLLFFVTIIIFLIQEAFVHRSRPLLMLTGMFLGLGTITKGTMLTLLPGILGHLFFSPKHKNILSKRNILIVFSVCILVLFPSLSWDITKNFTDFRYHYHRADFFSFSLIPTALFLGDLIVWSMSGVNDSVFHLRFSYEYAFCNWLMGILCLAGALYFLKKEKSDFISLLLWIFWSIFIFFSFVRAKTGGGAYFHFDNFWWAIGAVIPGFILGAAMLVELSARHKVVKYGLVLIIIYFFVNSFRFASFPALCCIPRASMKVYELKNTAKYYLQQGEPQKAEKLHRYIEKHYPGYK